MLEIAKREAIRTSEKWLCTWLGFVNCVRVTEALLSCLTLFACRCLLAQSFRSESIWFADVTRLEKVGCDFGCICYSSLCSTVDWIEVTTLTLRS